MYGDAAVAPDFFHGIVDAPRYDFRLFAPPNQFVSTADHLIGLYVSALIRDGGTLQLGIGSLGDAVTYMIKLRHERNALYRDLVAEAGVFDKFNEIVERVGGTAPFHQGLYASSEMLVHGFLELYRCGVLKRKVHDDPDVQRRLNAGEDPEGISGTHVAHACFFLGPESFYEALRRMDPTEREQICMTGIAFVNTGLIVALSGAVASDALEDGRVVSGVGGQYNFVSMAHDLEDGRSILLIRSTHEARGRVHSNIRATYSSSTIPRHLRDIVVTEYGIGGLRGRTDEEVVLAKALRALKRMVERKRPPRPRSRYIRSMVNVPEAARVYLERMGLAAPRTLKERLLRRTVLYALASVDAA